MSGAPLLPPGSRGTARIALFGEMLIDQFGADRVVGGAPLNVARHLAAFGHAPLLIGAIGADDDADLVRGELERYGVRADGVQIAAAHATGVVDVTLDDAGGHRFVIRAGAAWDAIAAAPALAALAQLGPDAWLYAGTLALRSPTSRMTGMALLNAHGGATFVDMNWREGHVAPEVALEAIRHADVLKVNEDELLLLCRWLDVAHADAAEPAAIALRAHLGLGSLLVTRGQQGALAVDERGSCQSAAASERPRVVDTVGAGDAFAAVALAGLLRGWDTATVLSRANDFGGRICEVRGPIPPDMDVYRSTLASWLDVGPT